MNYEELKDSLFVKRLRNFLTELQIRRLLFEMDEVCNNCWDSDSECKCWDDD